jgi:hypothetical protein
MRMIGVILLIYEDFGLALPDGKKFCVLHQHLAAVKGRQRRTQLMKRTPVGVVSSDHTLLRNLYRL